MGNNRPPAMLVENAILKALVRSLTRALINALDHSANLNKWKASYFIVKASPSSYESYRKDTIAERHVLFHAKYKEFMSVIEEAVMFLEGNELIMSLTSLDRLNEVGVFLQDKDL